MARPRPHNTTIQIVETHMLLVYKSCDAMIRKHFYQQSNRRQRTNNLPSTERNSVTTSELASTVVSQKPPPPVLAVSAAAVVAVAIFEFDSTNGSNGGTMIAAVTSYL